jgi:hypothetical protein
MKNVFDEYPLRHSMDLVELGARSMDLVDLEFLELGCLPEKKWSGAVFVDLELRGALPNTHVSTLGPCSRSKKLWGPTTTMQTALYSIVTLLEPAIITLFVSKYRLFGLLTSSLNARAIKKLYKHSQN